MPPKVKDKSERAHLTVPEDEALLTEEEWHHTQDLVEDSEPAGSAAKGQKGRRESVTARARARARSESETAAPGRGEPEAAPGGAGADTQPAEPALRQPRPGDVLAGRYVLKEKLGEGGSCSVFLATVRDQPTARGVEGRIAVKILRPELAAEPAAVELLRRQCELNRRLRHPHIARIYEFVEDGDTHFATMEALDGGTLRQRMSGAKPWLLPRLLAFRIIREIGEALEYAHKAGIVHGDLKPENVIVDQQNRVKVLDFSQEIPPEQEPWMPADDETPPPRRRLTPAYASYERLRGAPPRRADDIYALACIAYELLSGARPWGQATAVDAKKGRLVPANIEALSATQWQALRRGFALMRDERTTSVGEFLRDFLPPVATGSARVLPARRISRARPFMWSAALVALVVLGVVGLQMTQGGGPLMERLRGSTRSATERVSGLLNRTPARNLQIGLPGAGGDDSGGPKAEAPAAPASGPSAVTATPPATASSSELSPGGESPADNASSDGGGAAQAAAGAAAKAPSHEPAAAAQTGPGGGQGDHSAQGQRPAGGSESAPPESTADGGPRAAASEVGGSASAGGPATFSFVHATRVVSEADQTVALAIRRTGSTAGKASVVWWTGDGSAREGDDFAGFGRTVETFDDGVDLKTIYIPIASDGVREDVETFFVYLGNPSDGARLGEVRQVAITIVDDD